MAKQGYTGYTVTLVLHDGKPMILCWSPRPVVVPMDALPNLLLDLEEYMTETRENWRYWQDLPLQLEDKHD